MVVNSKKDKFVFYFDLDKKACFKPTEADFQQI